MPDQSEKTSEFIDSYDLLQNRLFLVATIIHGSINLVLTFEDFKFKALILTLSFILLLLWLPFYSSLPVSSRIANLIPLSIPTLNEVSLQVADNRYRKLEKLEGNIGVIETPQIIDSKISDIDEYFQIAELDITSFRNLQKWYMKSPELLLSERVIDGVNFLYKQHDLRKKNIPFPTIKLTRGNYRDIDKFPYEIIVQTKFTSIFKSILTPYLDWFGIRILLQHQDTNALYFGSCVEKGGLNGIAGGGIRNSISTFPMTCAHVVSNICASTMLKCNPDDSGNNPDVAILQNNSPCFIVKPKKERAIHIATKDDVDLIIKEKSAVNKIYPNSNQWRQGEIDSRIMAFETEGNFHRFPHLCILPKFNDRGFFITPLFNKRFSKKGDSGSWVVDTGYSWVGMIVGGRPKPYYISYVIEAEPLMEFLSGKLNTKIEPVTF